MENQQERNARDGLIGTTIRDLMSRPGVDRRARVTVAQSLLKIAEGLDSSGDAERERQRKHLKLFDRALRIGQKMFDQPERDQWERFQLERRDMQDQAPSGAYPGSTSSFFTPVLYEGDVLQMMKAMDRLFDEDVVTIQRTDRGGPLSLPMLDDTSSEATVVAQGQAQVVQEPQTIGQLSFETATTWATGVWKVSRALLGDEAVDIGALFANTTATRLRRGIGKSFVSTLLSGATLGWVAEGSAANDGVGGINSASTDDLHNLLASVNPEYLASPKARWLMNFNTYQSLLTIKDRQGHPALVEQYNADGEPMLLGKPVAICPSMPSMSSTISSPQVQLTPIAVGDLGRFVVRVAGPLRMIRLDERFAEYFQVGFEAFLRADGQLALTPGSDSPIKYMVTAG